ncbi:MAG: iron-containing alcohol dehydrogenase, partial [Rhizomicrobium sp.]
MNNFEYRNPTHIVFGKGQVAALDTLIAPEARVLILYGGGSVKKNGTLDEVKAALKDRVVGEFSGIEPNPTFETMMKAVELIRREKYDFLLAVGGGSVIDGTKFVAAAVNYPGDTWDIPQVKFRAIANTMPFGTVLTLPATGSEMNCASVITRRETKTKLGFFNPNAFPQFSILDPTKTYTLPVRQLANGVVDSFVHIFEQYMTYPAQAMVQDRFAEGLLKTLVEIGPKVLSEGENYDVRANFMWTATLALNGLIGAGAPQDWATHLIGHEITALYEV